MSSFNPEQYVGVFLEELDEQIQVMDEEILRLENEGFSNDGIQALFRAAHTIKGSSAALGYEKLKQLTHEMESLMDRIRNHELEISPPIINLLFQALDAIKEIKGSIASGQAEEAPIEGIVRNIQRIKAGEEAEGSAAAPRHRELGIRVKLHAACEMKIARAALIYNKLSEWGEVLRMTPPLTAAEELGGDKEENFEVLHFIFKGPHEIQAMKDVLSTMMDVELVEMEPHGLDSDSAPDVPPAAKPAADKQGAAGDKGDRAKPQQTQTIRVNVERLEQMMNLVGELVIDQTRIHQVKRNLGRKFKADDDVEELMLISDHVTRTIGDLQEEIMKARMLPIEQLFNRFPRMVRDLSQSLDKKVKLTLEGNETELDRTLIEEIGDPLIHLIRNALDHGIESPEQRLQAGKPAEGALNIQAYHQDNQVNIMIEDDGAGIDPEKIKTSAVYKKLISAEEAGQLSDSEAVNLIFMAGFSTAQTVSDVSGRGVGMDIVRSDIERLNGLIEIETEIGKGTRFRIRLPLTLAIITGLLIRIHERPFIVPMGNVAEIIRIAPEKIGSIRGEPAVVIRNQVIPLVYPHDVLQYPRADEGRRQLPIVIVGSAEKRAALCVDELIGNQEIVIKTLGSYIGHIDFISGSTILGDGKVALILDVADFLKTAGVAR